VGYHPTPGELLRWNVKIHEGDTAIANMALKKFDDGNIAAVTLTTDLSKANGEFIIPHVLQG